MIDTITHTLIAGALTAFAIMIIAWIVCVRIHNAAWVDVVWAYSIGVLSLGYFLILGMPIGPQLLGFVLIAIWSLRLGTHLLIRIATEPEDGRYQEIKKQWGGERSPKLFGFFMIQAAAAFFFSIPPLLAMHSAKSAWSANDWIAVVIAIIAISGETLADRQLRRFKANPKNQGKVCKSGLWRYSRHPNYFFEWIFWLAFPSITWGSSAFFPALAAPLIMLFLILKMTGIPPTEAQAIRKRGESYRQYQRETSAFFPWFPKSETTTQS
ncbi:MAG: DUF1295 domain-containing protein [Puniceicoccaceae bacterium]